MLMTRGGMTFSEIMDQPNVWQKAIRLYNQHRETLVWIRKMKFNQIIFIGAGASHYAAQFSSFMFRELGRIHAEGFCPSDIFATNALPFHPRLKNLVVVFSRSGGTEEILWATEYLKKKKPDIHIIGVVCQGDSSLQKLCDTTILIEDAADEVILPIKSFSTSLYLFALFAGALGGNSQFLKELSKIPKEIDLKGYHEEITKIRGLRNLKKLVFMGTGAFRWLGAYGSFLTKAASSTTSFDFESFELRHNQYLALHNETLTTCILSERLRMQEVAAMRDAAKMKSMVLLLADDIDEKIEAGVEYSIKFKSNLSYYAQAFHIIPCLQFLAFQHSIAKGKNPDKPKNMATKISYKSKPDFI